MANQQPQTLASEARHKKILTIVFTIICVIWVLPVVCVAINSFKLNTFVKTETFALPTEESFAGWSNFITGMTFGNYPFWSAFGYSALITVLSTALILSAALWRPGTLPVWTPSSARSSTRSASSRWSCPSRWSCSLSKTAGYLKLNTPGPSQLSTWALVRALRSSCSSAS